MKIVNILGKSGFFLCGLYILVLPFPVLADSYNQTEVKKTILVDKKLKSVDQGDFVDNLSANDKVFVDDNLIEFSIKVENSGTENLTSIDVVDYLPKFLELISFPGTYDSKNNSISWKIESLNKGESKTFNIRAKIQGVNYDGKMINFAEAKTNGIQDKDQAVYYIGTKKIPVTGNETLILNSLIGLTGIGGALMLRKFGRGY